jgi:prephenate dehydratase
MSEGSKKLRVAFQGEAGAFSEAAAVQLLGEAIVTIPRPTFDATFRAITDRSADALLVPVENSLAGSVVRVYDLLLESELRIVAETILPIELHLIGCAGAALADIRVVSSHPMALAQCERFFGKHSNLQRSPAEDTAGSVREVLARGDRARAAIAGGRAALRYGGTILAESIQDNAENFTRFVMLEPAKRQPKAVPRGARKMSLAMRLAHQPGSLLSALQPFARYGVNLLKIESRPIHGKPWEYQFFIDIEAEEVSRLDASLEDLRQLAHEVRILGLYAGAKTSAASS